MITQIENAIINTLKDPHFWGVLATGAIYVIGTYFPSVKLIIDTIASAVGIVVIKSAATAVVASAKKV